MGACCYEFSPADVYREEWPVANKEHCCCECGTLIGKGTDYQHITQLWEGEWWDYKTCELCADLRDSLADVDCPAMEGLAECFTEWLNAGSNTVMNVKPGTHAAKLVPSYYLEELDDEN